jgi:hypothetical protein
MIRLAAESFVSFFTSIDAFAPIVGPGSHQLACQSNCGKILPAWTWKNPIKNGLLGQSKFEFLQ